MCYNFILHSDINLFCWRELQKVDRDKNSHNH